MRKKVMAVVVAVLAFSLIAASAASLGGVNASGVGADTGVVASCDTNGVNVDFTLSAPGVVSDVQVSGIHGNCDGEDVYITLLNGTVVLATAGPETVSDGGTNNNSVFFSGLSVDPYLLDHVYVVIG